jgi:hypothetical protein
MGNVAAFEDSFFGRGTIETRIGTQVLAGSRTNFRARIDNGIEHRLKLRDIMMIRCGHDEG